VGVATCGGGRDRVCIHSSLAGELRGGVVAVGVGVVGEDRPVGVGVDTGEAAQAASAECVGAFEVADAALAAR
jgi:hypothetical protein